MELNQVDPDSYAESLEETLKTLYSPEETEELIDGLIIELEEISELVSIKHQGEEIGFIIITPLFEADSEDTYDLVSVEDIFTKSGYQTKAIADSLSKEIKTLSDRFNVPQVEVIINQSNNWLSDSLIDHGFISSEVKLEKLLPRSNNLDDVLELIQDCTPIDRIVQVLLEKDEEFTAEFVDTSDELSDLIDDGWDPVMVVVTFEPEGSNLEEQIEESDQLINWDDFSIVYYG